jgi:FkbM family methyltransferase
MKIRDRLKRILNMCGHAMTISVHNRLDRMEARLGELRAQNVELAENHNAILQTAIHTVEGLQESQSTVARQREAFQAVKDSVEDLRADVARALEQGASALRSLDTIVHLTGEGLQERQRSAGVQREAFEILNNSVQDLRAEFDKVLEQGEGSLRSLDTRGRLKGESLKERERIAGMQQSVEELRADFGKLLQQTASMRLSFDEMLTFENHAKEVLDQELVRQVCVETSDYEFTNPEIGLMAYLYSYLPTRKAIDVGAHVGDVAEALLKTGYEVFAFEPYAPVYKKLVDRLGKYPHLHPFHYALASVEAEAPLHLAKAVANVDQWGDPTVFNSLTMHAMPPDLPFSGTATVTVKDLAGLHKSKVIPEDVSLIKIDTEGYDLEVVRGMGEHRYPVVAVEFWNSDIPFGESGLLYTPQSMTEEMGRRGYHWYIVLYRVWGQNQMAFYCNHARPVPRTWGNMIFFRDFGLFSQGQAWCSAVLPRTYFKPAPSAQ